MPFTGDTFAHLFDWEKDPQRQEKIVNARLEAEFDGVDTGLSTVAVDLTTAKAPQFVTMAATSTLPNERVLTAGTGITITDGGAGAAVTIAGGRERLTANRTYYVRTDGSDSNDGLADTAGGAKLTIAAALTAAAALDCSTFDVTISCNDATRTASVTLPLMLGSGTFTLQSTSGTPTACIISTTNAHAVTATGPGIKWALKNIELRTATTGSPIYECLDVVDGAEVRPSNVHFGACARHQVQARSGGRIVFTANYTISGGATTHYNVTRLGFIQVAGVTVTVSGTPAFGTAFAAASSGGHLFAASSTYSGSATGPRFSTDGFCNISTGGGGASYFPGNSAGATDPGTFDSYT